MAKAFNKEVIRSITQSAGRFAAIAIISLLGAGFYAGLRMAAPDMRIAGGDFFEGTNLYDVSVISTLGLDDESIRLLEDVEGVGAVMPAYRANVMAQVDESSYATCVESLPLDAARASDTTDGEHAFSDDDGYLNRPILMEGAWPDSTGECVVAQSAAHKLDIHVGDEIRLVKGTTELEDTFAETTFAVSGLVNSAAYASTSALGPTSLGTGELELYMFVGEQAFAEDLPYSAAYLTVPQAKGLTWESDAYDAAVATVKARVDDMAADLGEKRYEAVRADAQAELDDARADYERERADAERKLDDAASELEAARSELDDAAAQLSGAPGRLASGKAELESGEAQIRESEAKLKSGEEQYKSGKAQLDAKRAQFEKQAAALPGMKSQRSQLTAGIDQASAGVKQLEAQLAQAKKSGAPEDQVKQIEAQLGAAQAQLSELQSQLGQLDAGIAAIEDGRAQLAAAQAQLDASRAELDKGWSQLEQARKKTKRGWDEYNSGMADYQSGWAQYQSGEADYASGLSEYEQSRADAEKEFADAEAELADAQADIDDIEKPDVFVLDRSKNTGAAQLASDSDGIQQIATFLPFAFFLVAALVSLTSMTRMVDEERMVIGTHKALGYGRARITSKYLVYGMLASGLGSVAGVVLFGKLLPWFILTAYQVSYAVPGVPLPLDPVITAKALGLSVGVTTVATWGAAAASLRERPAALMLPRVPRAGKRIVLERIRPLWSRMSFSQKVTARNLLRYKRRFFMAVVGIAGCTALLMIGFGLRDAIGGIVSTQYEVLMRYDAAVRVDDDASDEARAQVDGVFGSDQVEGHLSVADFNMVAKGEGDDMRIEVVVPEDPEALVDFVVLRDRESGQPVELEPGQLVITEKAARTLNLQAGDEVLLYDENDVGDAIGDGRTFTVGGITENYLGHFAYMLPATYDAAYDDDLSFNLSYVKLAEDADTAAFSDELLSIDDVNTVSFVAEKMSTYKDMLDIMSRLIVVIIMLSAALAFVVLYNLTNINITERVREIATLKVLGFTRGEMNAYIFREILVMALIGALVGCIVGVPATFYIAEAAETPYMMFGRAIEPMSFVLSFAITMVFTVIVAFTMRGKLYRVNMVESLKSIE